MNFIATSTTRIVYSVIVTVAGVLSWVVVGIVVRIVVPLAPEDDKFISGTFDVGRYTFDVTVFTAMIFWTAVMLFLLGRSLIAVWKGKPLRECFEFWQ
jgi:hypothetical protein